MMKYCGLIAERHIPIDGGRVVVERRWDLNHPECPMVLSPFHPQLDNGRVYVDQRILSAETYRNLFGTRCDASDI